MDYVAALYPYLFYLKIENLQNKLFLMKNFYDGVKRVLIIRFWHLVLITIKFICLTWKVQKFFIN